MGLPISGTEKKNLIDSHTLNTVIKRTMASTSLESKYQQVLSTVSDYVTCVGNTKTTDH